MRKFFILLLIIMIFSNLTVFAETEFPFSDFPYEIKSYWCALKYDANWYIFMSDYPIQVSETDTTKRLHRTNSSTLYEYHKTSSTYTFHGEKNTTAGYYNSRFNDGFFSNHDIINYDTGDVFFSLPIVPSLTIMEQAGTVMGTAVTVVAVIAVGLIGFLISLKVLPLCIMQLFRYLRKFTTS